MIYYGDIYIDVQRINVAHEFVLDSTHRCEYPGGRGQYGIVYVLDGEAEYRFVSGERCVIRSGDMLFLSPAAAYSTVIKGDFRHYTINFDIHENSSNTGIPQSGYRAFSGGNTDKYRQVFKRVVTVWSARLAGYEMMAVSYLYELLSLVHFDMYNVDNGTVAHLRLQKAKKYIEQNFRDTIRLEELSELSDMSLTNFRREWARIYKESPMQYRDRIRLSYAKEYLMSEYYTVSEVADKCGFSDVSYFVRFFKKHTGVSPGAFRRSPL